MNDTKSTQGHLKQMDRIALNGPGFWWDGLKPWPENEHFFAIPSICNQRSLA